MDYRPAGPDDAEAIARLHTDSWRRSFRGLMDDEYLDHRIVEERGAVWRERFDTADPHRHVILAEEAGRLAGFICTYAGADERWGTLLDNLHVAREFQRRGIGAELMRRAAAALEAGHAGEGVFLFVLEGNDAARRFYERYGARNAGHEIQIHPDGNPAPCFRYVWPHPRALIDAITKDGTTS